MAKSTTNDYADKNKRVVVSLRLDEDTYDRLKDRANREAIPIAALARIIVEDGLDKRFFAEQVNTKLLLDRIEGKLDSTFELVAKNRGLLLRSIGMQTLVEVSEKMDKNKEFEREDWKNVRMERIVHLVKLAEEMIGLMKLRED